MSSLKTRQFGFGTVGILVIVVAVLVISGVGYVVLKKSSEAKNTEITQKTNSPTPATRADKTSNTHAAQPYILEIKEWGVSVPLSESVKDAYYTTAGAGVGDDGLANTVWVSLKSFNASGCDVTTTGPTENTKPVGAILRVLPTDLEPVKGVPYKDLYTGGIMIGKYYYVYRPWTNASCASKESLQAANDALQSATKQTTPTAATVKQ